MESILARALEYTLKYWLKSFSRDQFKLQGRIAQLSNLDINGEALHSSMGLPPALNVTTAKVGKLEIMLPSISNVQTEPIVVRVDRLDVVLEEKTELDACSSPSSAQSSSTSTKSSSYGFADKISDGMTLEVRTVNLLLETRRGPQCQGGAIWASPMASITIHNLFLYTTNEKWQVVNLKEARDFNNNKNFIYVFRKLEWDSLSVDLLPHPDMFMGAQVSSSHESMNKRDVDGAKRVFFGGERFVEGISGQANITIQRTELNSPLGLEVQLHITEAVCPALSEPGLRAFLRFLTGLYVCLNRDVNPEVQEQHSEAAGRSLISITVDHIFFCIKDAEFRLELLMQSLFFSRASVSDGETAKGLTCVMIAGLFLRDTFSHPPCTLVQPSMQAATGDCLEIPEFGENFCPPIYPMRDQQWLPNVGIPLVCLHSFQIKPSPSPPSFASQTVINCQPLMIYLQEESCLRICSFLADGVVISPGSVLPDYSVNSLKCDLKELDLTVPLEMKFPSGSCTSTYGSFTAARLQIGSMFFSDSPSLKLRLLNMERDPACFCLWEDQPVDASQKKWTAGALHLTLSLQTSNDQTSPQSSSGLSSGLWRCVELRNACIEVAMVTADGSPLIRAPPPGGVVRVGVACQQYMSSTSVEQLFFVLDLYAYLGRVSDKIVMVGDDNRPKVNRTEISNEKLMEKVPSDTAVSLKVNDIEFRFLESSSLNIPAITLAQFVGSDLFITAAHRTFGGAIGVSFNIRWENIRLDCIDAEGNSSCDTIMAPNGFPQLRTIFWVNNPRIHQSNGNVLTTPFLDINIEHMIPYIASNGVCHSLLGDLELHSLSISTCIAGVRLGGGLRYTEELLHRFGILGPDGGPGEGLTKGLDNLSAGPLSKLFKPAPIVDKLDDGSLGGGKDINFWNLGIPDDADISIEFRDWLFALEGVHEMEQNSSINTNCVDKKGRCWHTTFKTLKVRSSSSAEHKQHSGKKSRKRLKYPVELVTVSIEGLQTLKPQVSDGMLCNGSYGNGVAEIVDKYGGIDLEVHMVTTQDDVDNEIIKWTVENVKVAIKEPIEVVVTKDELQCIAFLYQSEVDSMGRIAAGILRALKLEKCVGQEAVDQLSNLGSEGFSRILSQGMFSTRVGLAPPLFKTGKRLNSSIEFTVTSLEEALLDSQAHCDSLVSELDNSELSQHVKQLSQKLDRMQNLLIRLRTQV